MQWRLVPVALVAAALLADAQDQHRVGFYLLLAAVPVAAALALTSFGELVELAGGAAGTIAARFQALLAGLGLTLVLIATAVRTQAAPDAVPELAVSAAVGCLVVLGAQAVAALARA